MEEQQLRLSILSCLKPEAFDIDKFIAWWLEQDLEWRFGFASDFDGVLEDLAKVYKNLYGIDDLYSQLAENQDYIDTLNDYGYFGQDEWAEVIDAHGSNVFYDWYKQVLNVLAQDYQWIFNILVKLIPKVKDEEIKETIKEIFTGILEDYLEGR